MEENNILNFDNQQLNTSEDKKKINFNLFSHKYFYWLVMVFLIIAVSFMVLRPVLDSKVILFDDESYLLHNTLVKNPSIESCLRFFTELLNPSTVKGYYQPVTMVSLMLDYLISGSTDLYSFHRTGMILHILNSLLLMLFLYLLFKNKLAAFIPAFLFSIHPLAIGIIPWVAERKTLLSTAFALISMILYALYVKSGKNIKSRYYWLAIIAFILSLLSKPLAVSLPIILLILDYWPLNRLSKPSFFEKAPFILLSICSSVITYISQANTFGLASPAKIPFIEIILKACQNITYYLQILLYPVGLASYCTIPEPLNLNTPTILLSMIIICLIFLVVLVSIKWTKSIISCFLIFLISLTPVIGVVRVSDSLYGDVYAYFPSIGIFLLLSVLTIRLIDIIKKTEIKRIEITLVAAVLVILSVFEATAARDYIKCWENNETIYKHMIKVTQQFKPYRVYTLLGGVYMKQSRINESIECFNKSIELKPEFNSALNYLSIVYTNTNNYDKAEEALDKSMKINPKDTETYICSAKLLQKKGDINKSLNILLDALNFTQNNPELNNEIGLSYALLGDNTKAQEYYLQTIKFDPVNINALFNLANLYSIQGKFSDAVNYYLKVIDIDDKRDDVYINLGKTIAQYGNFSESYKAFKKALSINPLNPNGHYYLGMLYEADNKNEDAVEEYKKVLELNPDNTDIKAKINKLIKN